MKSIIKLALLLIIAGIVYSYNEDIAKYLDIDKQNVINQIRKILERQKSRFLTTLT